MGLLLRLPAAPGAALGLLRDFVPGVSGVLGLLHARLFSTQPDAPSFKAQTRALLKLVHPDQFHQYPIAREANERSFKLLQEYLAAAKTGGGIGRTAGLPYHFTFYVREAEQQEAGGAAAAAPAEAPAGQEGEEGVPAHFRKVTLTLPPPTKTGPGDSPSPATLKAFSRLLRACGLPADLPADVGAIPRYSRLTSLREFVPLVAEQVHQAAAQQAGPRQQLSAVRTALRLGRSVVVGFAEPAASAGVLAQLTAAQQLVAVLDALPQVNLSGLRVTVGEAYGIDALGAIWLHAGDSQQAWSRYLANVDVAYCRERQALLQAVRAQEAAVARALRVAMLYTHPQLSLDPAYLAFLERTAAAAVEQGPVGQGRLQEVPVMVQPDPSQGLDADASGPGSGSATPVGAAGSSSGLEVEAEDPLAGPTLDDTAGVVCIPVGTSPADLWAALARLGPQAQAVLQRAREEEAAAARLRTNVERKLRLRRLSRAPGLAPERFRAACLRLAQHGTALAPLLEGLAVRVAEVNGLPPDHSWVDIAWDFEV